MVNESPRPRIRRSLGTGLLPDGPQCSVPLSTPLEPREQTPLICKEQQGRNSLPAAERYAPDHTHRTSPQREGRGQRLDVSPRGVGGHVWGGTAHPPPPPHVLEGSGGATSSWGGVVLPPVAGSPPPPPPTPVRSHLEIRLRTHEQGGLCPAAGVAQWTVQALCHKSCTSRPPGPRVPLPCHSHTAGRRLSTG